MLVAAFTWGDLWRLALAVFLLAVGLSFAYLLVRLGGTVARLSAFIKGAEREVLPAINKVGGIGGRLDLNVADLDELQHALDALLGCREDGGEVEVVIDVEDDGFRSRVGPFSEPELAELGRDSAGLGLRRVLETVADGFEV